MCYVARWKDKRKQWGLDIKALAVRIAMTYDNPITQGDLPNAQRIKRIKRPVNHMALGKYSPIGVAGLGLCFLFLCLLRGSLS